MLRGAIDFNDGWRVGGWLYSPEVPVRDRLLLAFLDGACVGNGRIDRYRQDLADAGLGDGHCGFNFPIDLPRVDDRGRVYVKLDFSDLALLQQGARITDVAEAQTVAPGHSLETIDWMLGRQWIDEPDAAFLRDLLATGSHTFGLDADASPAAHAQRLFELYHQRPVRVQQSLIKLHNLAEERLRLIEDAAIPIIAIHASDGKIVLGSSARSGCTDHRLLFVDARAAISGISDQAARIYRAI